MITLNRRSFLVNKIIDFCKEVGANEALTAIDPREEPKLEFDVMDFDEDENGQISFPEHAHKDMPNNMHHPGVPGPPNIFDVFGFFRADTPDLVYLCPANILDYAAKFKNPYFWKVELQIVTEIVFVHECAHWLHYKLNAQDFELGTGRYIESWAQLCTKRICIELGQQYCQVFDKMLSAQPEKYTCFIDYQERKLGRVLKFFLKPEHRDPQLHKLDIEALNNFREKNEELLDLMSDLNDLGDYKRSREPFINETLYQKYINP